MKTLIGILSSILVCGNLVLASLPLFVMAFVRLVLRVTGLRQAASWMTEKLDRIIDFGKSANRSGLNVNG